MVRVGSQATTSPITRIYGLMVLIWTVVFPLTICQPQPLLAAFVDVTHDRLPTSNDATLDLAVGDVDADGDPDVLVVNHGQSHLLLNNGQGYFNDVTSTHLPVLDLKAMTAVFGDVDADDDLDLVLANGDGPNLLLLGDGQGHFARASASQLPTQHQVSMRMAIGDLDGDGDLDLVVANRASQNRVWINDGSGVFTDETAQRLPEDTNGTYDVVLADIDANGTLDLFVVNQYAPHKLYLNNGLGRFSEVSDSHLPKTMGNGISALAADVDADGDPDLLVAEGKTPLRLWRNDGTGYFTDHTATHLPTLNAYGLKVRAGDVDGDGTLDLVVAAAGQDQVLLNNGTGHFQDATASLAPQDDQRSFGLALFDADADLALDVLLGTPRGANRFWRNGLTRPQLLLTASPTYKLVGSPVTLTIDAFAEDGLGAARLTLSGPQGQEQTVDLLADLADRHATYAFTPSLAGDHSAEMTLTDIQSETTTRRLTFVVVPPDTTAPQIAIAVDAPTPTLVGHTVTLRLTVTDSHTIVGTQATVNGTPVALDSSGVATYLPTTAGEVTVAATATDSAGNVGQAHTTFRVEPDTTPPVVGLTVVPNAVDLTRPVVIRVSTTDNVAVTSRSLRISGPAIPDGVALTLDTDGRASYTPFQPGTYTVDATAQDPSGNIGHASATLTATGTPDTTSPVVGLSVVPTIVIPGTPVTITITATDNIGVTQTRLEVNDTPQPLPASGVITYTPPVVGTYTAYAEAQDAFDNTTSATMTFRAINASDDTTPPVIAIASPESDAALTAPTAIIGTVQDDTLVRYSLAYAPHGEDRFTSFATGTSGVTDGVLGTLDTSLLLNDLYDIRLTAEDSNGHIVTTTVVYQVTGHLKVGHFTMTLQDLAIPMVGLPITINRTYDSREKGPGDFGIGWRLDVQSMNVRENRVLGQGWEQIQGQAGFAFYYCVQPVGERYVAVTLPDGRVETFDFLPDVPLASRSSDTFGDLPPNCQFFAPISAAGTTFQARPGTTSRLEAVADANLLITGGEGPVDVLHDTDTEGIGYYDPVRYQLTTAEGLVFDLDQSFGVRKVTEPNGNTLTFENGGIIHSAGKSVTFTRDGAGRITQITDPLGHTLTYAYDTNGDLVAMTDQEGNTTRYVYDDAHRLVTIEDPRGITPARNIYDAAGRLVAHIDADGHRIDYTHDIDGRQEVIQDRLGYVTVYIYDADGNILSQTDPLGHTSTFTYDDQGNKISEANHLGPATTYTYDERGNLLSETTPLGQTTAYTYNDRNQLLTSTDPLGHVTTSTYDATGNQLTSTDSLGHTTTDTYDSQGNRIRTTDPLGHTTSYRYDRTGNLVAYTDALGHVTTSTYDANGNRLTMTTARSTAEGQPVSLTTRYRYDGTNRLIEQQDALGHTTRVTYDALGKRETLVDATGQQTTYTYDLRGQLITTTSPDGTTTTATYDAAGQQLSSTDQAGRTTHYTYDPLGRLTQTRFPDGSATAITYDAVGQILTTIDEQGNTITYGYDDAGHRTRVRDALGSETVYVYGANGRLVQLTDATGRLTTYSYDANDNRLRTTYADGTTTRATYDALGRRIALTDQAGQITHFGYNALGWLTAVQDALGHDTLYTYDEVGNRLTYTGANSHTTHWAYDDLGRVMARTLPLGMTETFTYDPVGNFLTHVTFQGQTITYTYDSHHRLTHKTLPDGTQVAYTYTPTQQRASVTDNRGPTTYHYDLRDRLLGITHPDGTALTYTYDATGNRTTVTSPAGTIAYTYDDLRRLRTVTAPDGGLTAYAYDQIGSLTQVTFPHGTTTHYTYDTRDRLTALEHTRSDGHLLARYTYTLSPTGQRLELLEDSGRHVAYRYDGLGRLREEAYTEPLLGPQTVTYAYDAVGNRLTRTDPQGTTTYTYDANDRALTAGPTIYTYDLSGNTLSQTTGTDTTTYDYDAENRLRQITTPHAELLYAYDADGVRVGRTVDGVRLDYVVDTQRRFSQLLETRDAAGALRTHSIYGHTLISQAHDGTPSYYHHDGVGSTRLLTDAQETITDTYGYDAFGTLLHTTGETPNTVRFAGEHIEAEAGLYHLRARDYAPALGRFLSRDSHPGDLYVPLSLHRYLYAHADPVNKRDPGGTFALADTLAAESIRTSLANLQADVGFRILDNLQNPTAQANIQVLSLFDALNFIPIVSELGTVGKVTKRLQRSRLRPGFALEEVSAYVDAFRRQVRRNRTGSRGQLDLLADFQKGDRVVRKTVFLDPDGFQHILERHTLPFFNVGGVKAQNSGWPSTMGPSDILEALREALTRPKQALKRESGPGTVPVQVRWNGTVINAEIVIGRKGRIKTFYPLSGPGVIPDLSPYR